MGSALMLTDTWSTNAATYRWERRKRGPAWLQNIRANVGRRHKPNLK
jgi:hypothetical protein